MLHLTSHIMSDIDECALEMDQCEQVCVNLNGSYSCECNEGYEVVSGRYYACEGKLSHYMHTNLAS